MIRQVSLAAALLALAAVAHSQDATLVLGDSFTGSIDSAFDTDAVQFPRWRARC